MKRPLALLPFVLPAAALAQTPARPNIPIKMSWSWLEHSGGKPVLHTGSLVVSFGCAPVEAGWDQQPEGDPDKPDTKSTRIESEKCGDEHLLAEVVRVYNYSKEIGVNYETTDELCRD